MPIVSLKNINKVFNASGATETVALQDVNLDIAPREFVSLIGPSGCGKSTLLRTIGDLIPPSTGAITVKDKSAADARLAHDYGMCFQAPVLFEWRSVLSNIELPLEILRVPKSERSERARAMLKLVELANFEKHYPWQLSGGMQQRVAIARALSLRPELLLMDEPFGALDEITRERMNGELLRIWNETGTTIVFVTHSIPEAVFLSTRVVVMSARPGRIAKIIHIDLPHPRTVDTRETPRYYQLLTEVREALRAAEQHEPS
jgi:NitT/TauT family transport system ATP-binding protein